jgi:hypothetical protein
MLEPRPRCRKPNVEPRPYAVNTIELETQELSFELPGELHAIPIDIPSPAAVARDLTVPAKHRRLLGITIGLGLLVALNPSCGETQPVATALWAFPLHRRNGADHDQVVRGLQQRIGDRLTTTHSPHC